MVPIPFSSLVRIRGTPTDGELVGLVERHVE